MKKSVGFVLSLVLIFSFLFPPQSLEAAVQSPGPKLRILEIVATGKSQLSGILGNDYEYTLMTMKKFVAQREELDGKYDMIAIMDGDYNSKTVSGSHSTTGVMNDITNLKANEIIKDFINKGQPVILSSNAIPKATKLKANFQRYLSSPPANVILFDSNNKIKGKVTSFLTGAYKQEPRFSLSSLPSKSDTFTYDQNLDFTVNVQVPSNISSRNLQAKLYIDSNFDDQYTTDEIVVEQTVTSNSFKLSYKLPKGYSGVRYWKVELVDIGNNLKSYQKGMIHFVDKKVELKVLQVYTNERSSLNRDNNPNNMNQSYLNTNEYKISIDATSMANFNKPKNQESNYSHEVINGKYDMVIFGFADSYNRSASINANAVASLEKFIASKQSIMFTHDTIFENNNNWVKHFMDDTGQISPQTNLGYGAPNTSTKTKKINEGLITTYPYALNDNITVAMTHNQYYTLDLEDDRIIPWYNIIGSDRDENDSWNHYYTYSKGNITYSGTGHRGGNDNFPVEEQKLFVNTMYRAFLGSNHAPEITVTTPTENQTIPTNQNIELAYTLQDYDLKDKKLSTKVFLNGEQVYAEKDVTTGATITKSIPHHLHDSGEVTIKIEATDESGAVSEKEVKVKVQKINANLEVRRVLKSDPLVEVGKPVEIEYKVTPKDIIGSEALAISGNSVTLEATLRESFPANLEVTSNGTKNGTVASGISLEKTIRITYNKVGNDFVASPEKFDIQVTPTEKKQYVLANSLLRYKDFTGLQKDLAFNTLSFNADKALTDIEFPSSYVLNKGTEKNFKIDLKMLPADAGIKSISWSEESDGQILKMDTTSGTAKILEEGSTFINVKVTDVFGKVIDRRVHVTVRIPVDSFILKDLTLELDEILDLPISEVKPRDEGKSSLVFKLANDSIAIVDKENLKIKGMKLGETTLTATGINSEGNPVERTAKITVIKVPVTGIKVHPSEVKMNKFEERNIDVTVLPDKATFKDVVWTSSNSSFVEVIGDGKIKGVGTGTANVEIASKDNPDVKTTVKVQVGQPLDSIIVPEITLQKGTTAPIVVNYSPADATNAISREYFITGNEKYISVSNGFVHGVRVGKTEMTVTVTDDKGKKHNALVKVTVTPKKESVTDDKQDKY